MATSTDQSTSQLGLYQCGECARSYTRLDHLARHVRSHTQEKPYECHFCAKRFGRVDLLKRHVEGHTSEGEHPRQRKRRRRGQDAAQTGRVNQACEACVKAHLRCEDEKPCPRCCKKQIPCLLPAETNVSLPMRSHPLIAENQNGQTECGQEKQTAGEELYLNTSNQHQPLLDGRGHLGMDSSRDDINALLTADPTESDSSGAFVNQSRNSVAPLGMDTDPSLPAYSRNLTPPLPLYVFNDVFGGHMQATGTMTPGSLMDFGLESNLELNDVDLSFLDNYNANAPFDVQPPLTVQDGDTSTDLQSPEGVALRAEIFKVSTWRFRPRSEDNATAQEHHLSSLHPADKHEVAEPLVKLDKRSTTERLQAGSRDKILALVLRTTSSKNARRVVEAFPSVELLDSLVQYYLTSPFARAREWLHLPTISPISSKGPELLTIMAAAGAILTPDLTLHKLGFALQEAVRQYSAIIWEGDNSRTRDLEILQAYTLQLEIGLWSGNSRKMEMAESFIQPLVTMLRRSGRFRYSSYSGDAQQSAQQEELNPRKTLEHRWKLWIEQESWIRLVFHVFEHVVHSSVALLIAPTISYAEMALPLPAHKSLWEATDAVAWDKILQVKPKQARRLTLIDCMNDVGHLSGQDHAFDVEQASLAYLHAQWGMVWEYRQLSSALRSTSNQSLLLASRHQELVRTLEDFRLLYGSVSSVAIGRLLVTLQMLLMHLHMPLEDVQLFAGIEGPEEARRAYPALQEWIKTPASRQALWHAGQILRLSRELPAGSLRNFFAICLYHVSLTFWVYGLVRQNNSPVEMRDLRDRFIDSFVSLDEEKTMNVRRFLSLNQGIPAISSRGSQADARISLGDLTSVLNVPLEILQNNHRMYPETKPPLTENLIQLIGGLQASVAASYKSSQLS